MNKKKTASKTSKTPLTVNRSEFLVNGSDNQFREMINNCLAFSVRLEAIRDGYAKFIGLTGIQYTILISIAHLNSGKGVGVNELAKHLSLSGTFLTTETRKLAQKELLSKNASEEDRRRVSLKLTKSGADLLERLSSIQCVINDIHFEPLADNDFQQFSQLMKDLTISTDRALITLENHLRLLDLKK